MNVANIFRTLQKQGIPNQVSGHLNRHISSKVTHARLEVKNLQSIGNSQIKSFFAKNIGSTTPVRNSRVLGALGYTDSTPLEKAIGPIHHLALRGIDWGDKTTTIDTVRNNLLLLGFMKTNKGPMGSILGSFEEFTPESSKKKIGIPIDPYVFTSTTQIEKHSEESQKIIEKLRRFFENPTELKTFKQSHRVNEIPLTKEDYTTLHQDNQYLAWYVTNYLAINGETESQSPLEPLNHFAYTLNNNPLFKRCDDINKVLEQKGLKINAQNGQKTQIEHYNENDTFEQSSTHSTPFKIFFLGEESEIAIPGAYEEFVRHPESETFTGFINAAGLFSSTKDSQTEKKKTP